MTNQTRKPGVYTRGFTLIEIMIVTALFIIVVSFIFSLFLATVRTAATQDAIIGMRDEARLTAERTMQMVRGGVNLMGVDVGGNPVDFQNNGDVAARVTFRYPSDLDGDLVIMDPAELTGTMTLGLDLNDDNGDGRSTDQIILLDDDDDILNVFSSRAIPTNIDANGGFRLQRLSQTFYRVTITLRSNDILGYPIVVTESRDFERKNINIF